VLVTAFFSAPPCAATNWHCFYTNCLYAFVPDCLDGRTVTAVRVEYGLLQRATQFGPLTNTRVHTRLSAELPRTERGFAAYLFLGGEQHRLWDWVPFDVAAYMTTSIEYTEGAGTTLPTRVFPFTTGRDVDGVINCAPRHGAARIEARRAEATRALDAALERHGASPARTNNVLFLSFWGYVS
jgi:hypothetical protein